MTLADVRRYALSLPEASEEPHHELSSFRVSGKIFATVPPDGGHLHVFADEPDRELAFAIAPDVFEKLFWGKKVAGVRVGLVKADPVEVRALLRKAWLSKAPKKLAAMSVLPLE